MYEHLLVALDGSEAAEHVLPHVEALAEAFHSTVTLVSAVASLETIVAASTMAGQGDGTATIATPIDASEIVAAEHSGSTDYLAGIANRLRQKGLTVTVETPEGEAADAIVNRAKALDVSLILMTTHGRTGLGRIVFGSTADKVLRHAQCPVLLVRIKE